MRIINNYFTLCEIVTSIVDKHLELTVYVIIINRYIKFLNKFLNFLSKIHFTLIMPYV